MRNTLEDEATKYLRGLKGFLKKEKVSWNEGGELYLVTFRDKTEKTLFATSLEKNQIKLKIKFLQIYDEGKNNENSFVRCEEIHIEDIVEECEIKGCYIFILMEKITPLIELILDEKYVEHNQSPNNKKIQLLSNIIQASEAVKYICKNHTDINMFINNEEICLDENGSAKLLLFDMIKNEIATNNQVYELERFMKQMASGLGISINIGIKKLTIEHFIKKCIDTKEKLIETENRYMEKLKKNLEEAKQENPIACSNLGYMYENGRGTAVDYKKAFLWYEKSANNNYAPAMNNLAHMYQKGLGVDKDYSKAIECLMAAAKLKDPVAQFNLGIAYHKGKGVKRDLEKALFWYKKSAKNGNRMAKTMCQRLSVKHNNTPEINE